MRRHPVQRLAAMLALLAAGVALVPATTAADSGPKSPPVSFTWSPATPAAGQPVVFTVTPAPVAAALSAALWDFNGDRVFDALGPTVTTTFAVAGPKVVRLVVVGRGG